MNPQLVEKVENVSQAIHQANIEFYNIWISDILFEWHWWLNLILAVGPWNFSIIPVSTMLILQYKSRAKPLLKAIPFS